MGRDLKVNIKMDLKMGKESYNLVMGVHMKGNSRITKLKGMEFILGKRARYMKVIGRETK